MPEFLQLLSPDAARELLFSRLAREKPRPERVETGASLGRVTAEPIVAPHALPEFPRSTVDGYAVRSRDTFGAGDSQPAYLELVGEVPMGGPANVQLGPGQCAIIHTGGMLPDGSDAVVMLEYTQIVLRGEGDQTSTGEVEVLRAAAAGENTIAMGEDVAAGSIVIPQGRRIRPAEIGGLMALGITGFVAARRPRVGLISSGDEVVDPAQRPQPGQVRDVNSYSLAGLIEQHGGMPGLYGIVGDEKELLRATAAEALQKSDAVIITAGSSASLRDMTAEVIDTLGAPGVLVHGINTRPGKPTILGVCNGKAVIGLPGNPVSALVNGSVFVVPLIERLLGVRNAGARPSVRAVLTVNLASQAGREDWWPVQLVRREGAGFPSPEWEALPIFGKSNLIFSLVSADGLLRISPDATGLAAGEMVDVFLL